ncbi:hypothetical protein BIW11_14231 [Tropilaelaps mercedesae]|uniref:Uncharacterized protein n=1 Tax=Tropilaelaps mercedesae TaxID=418985 RepID=A0A1V9WYI2_9ACAR|nr:hypothetical protein BIW11_14231 [Tropilaelaps mercedesae]
MGLVYFRRKHLIDTPTSDLLSVILRASNTAVLFLRSRTIRLRHVKMMTLLLSCEDIHNDAAFTSATNAVCTYSFNIFLMIRCLHFRRLTIAISAEEIRLRSFPFSRKNPKKEKENPNAFHQSDSGTLARSDHAHVQATSRQKPSN